MTLLIIHGTARDWVLSAMILTSKENLIHLRYCNRYKKTANEKLYERLYNTCSAYASCNTTITEFTISVDYTEKGNTTKQTYYFPYTTNNDKKAFSNFLDKFGVSGFNDYEAVGRAFLNRIKAIGIDLSGQNRLSNQEQIDKVR